MHGHFKFFLREQVKGYKTYEHKKEKKKRRMNEKYRKEKKKNQKIWYNRKKKKKYSKKKLRGYLVSQKKCNIMYIFSIFYRTHH